MVRKTIIMANAKPKPRPMRSRKSGLKVMNRIKKNLEILKKLNSK